MNIDVERPLTSYRCKGCGVTVMVAVSVRRVACWRCRRRMQTVKDASEERLSKSA